MLAHNISLINVQAGVGLHLMDTDPEQARDALGTDQAREQGRARRAARGARPAAQRRRGAPRARPAGLEQLDGARRAACGRPSSTCASNGAGTPATLPAGLDLAAFRIVQEALTNVVRHASNATYALVRVDYGDDELTVQVDDDGRATPIGQRHVERAAASPACASGLASLGGDLDAGPRPGGGFRVRARFPIERIATAGQP